MDKLKMHSVNKVDENIKKIGALFPNALTEVIKGYREDGKAIVEQAIDFDVLRQELSGEVVEGPEERYQFSWPDKRKSILLANAPIAKTLRPCREESVDFDNTENLYIEGDNLDALKLLQETYLGKVKMIYIDPPYNTGNDFVYEDDFAQDVDEYLANSGQFDEYGNRLVQNTESNGRFHTDWLNMIYPRLKLAKDLLTDDGVIFISCDDNEVDSLKKACNEIFGAINFAGCIIWKKKTNGNNVGVIPPVHDYIIVYARNIAMVCDIGYELSVSQKESTYSNPDNDSRGLWDTMDLSANHKGPYFAISNPLTEEVFYPPKGRYWVFNEAEVAKRILDGRIIFGKSGNARPVQKVFLNDRKLTKRKAESWWDNHGMNEDATAELTGLFGVAKIFSHPKPTKLLKNICSIVLEKNDIVLDFFSGSGTTADAVMQINAESPSLNARFILIQLPEDLVENLASADNNAKAAIQTAIDFLQNEKKPLLLTEIGKERIRRAGKKIKGEAGLYSQQLDVGFRVLKVDSTNMEDVYYSPTEYNQNQIKMFADNIKPDRSPEDLLFQVMLDLGVLLSSKIEEIVIGGQKVFNVADGYLLACFDNNVTDEVVTEIAKKQPYYAVFRDSSMASDSVAANFEQIFTTYSPTTVRKVL